MSRKLIRFITMTVLLVAVFPLTSLSTHASEESFTIGLSLPTADSPFFEGLTEGAQAAADELEAELVVVAAESDPEIELANVQELIDQGVDALVLRPVDATLSVPALQAANEADVPVILLGYVHAEDEETAPEVASVIATNNEEGGTMAADVLCEALNRTGTVLELVAQADDALSARNTSFEAAMTESCPKVSVMAFEVGDLEGDALSEALVEVFSENDLDGVFGFDSAMTQLALEASLIADLNLIFVGFDVTEDSLAAVQLGRLQALITPNGWEMGYAGVETSVALLNGEEIADHLELAAAVLDLETIAAFRACPPINPKCR